MNDAVFSHLLETFNEKKNSHAFLMETNNPSKCFSDIINLIKEINKDIINLEVDMTPENYPDLKVVFPDGKEIKKGQIMEIIENFQTFPFLLKHRYYIINSSDLMNQSSANVLLKFLEEPTNDIIGFFITTNKQAVINTIVSRCQCNIVTYDKSFTNNIKIEEFLSKMEEYSNFRKILFIDNFFSKNRKDDIDFLKELQLYLLNNINPEELKKFTRRIEIISLSINKLQKNANQDLVFLDIARKW